MTLALVKLGNTGMEQWDVGEGEVSLDGQDNI